MEKGRAIVIVKVYCGCGYETNNPLEAQEHCKETGHVLDISGKVFPNDPEPSPITREA